MLKNEWLLQRIQDNRSRTIVNRVTSAMERECDKEIELLFQSESCHAARPPVLSWARDEAIKLGMVRAARQWFAVDANSTHSVICGISRDGHRETFRSVVMSSYHTRLWTVQDMYATLRAAKRQEMAKIKPGTKSSYSTLTLPYGMCKKIIMCCTLDQSILGISMRAM